MKDFERDNEILLIRKATEKCAAAAGTVANWATFFGVLMVLKIIALILHELGVK